MPETTPPLMFTGQAEEAMNAYVSVFEDASIVRIDRYGAGEQGAEGFVQLGEFVLQGQRFMRFDGPPVHAFTFTPSISLFVTCRSEAEVDTLFERLSEGAEIAMPLDAYPFSPRYAWITNRLGVSWQLSAPLTDATT